MLKRAIDVLRPIAQDRGVAFILNDRPDIAARTGCDGAHIGPDDMPNYCVFGNQIYSLGSGLCIGRAGYICVPATGPTTGNRAFWTGKDDQVFTRPQCS